MVLPRHPKGPVQPPHVGSGQRPPRRRFLQPVQVNLFERFLRESFPRHSIRVADQSDLSAAAAVLTHTHVCVCAWHVHTRACAHTHTLVLLRLYPARTPSGIAAGDAAYRRGQKSHEHESGSSRGR